MTWSLFSQSELSPLAWAQAELESLNVPLTAANEQSLIAWALLEGGGGTYNPLNTSQPEPGSTSFNSDNVQNYPDWATGYLGTTATIEQPAYKQIDADLKSGKGIGATPELSTWSGNGYGSLSADWNEAAQYMSGKPAASQPSSSSSSGGLPGWVTDIFGGAVTGVASKLNIGGDITDILERGALMLFGAVLIVIGLLKIAGNEEKITLNQPVSDTIAAAPEAAVA